MLNIEIRFVMHGREVSLDSCFEAIVREVRDSVRDEISRALPKEQISARVPPPVLVQEMPRHAVSVREAARLLSVSQRTIQNYIALKAIRAVRVERRVLIPMKSVNEVAAKGIPHKCAGQSSPVQREGNK